MDPAGHAQDPLAALADEVDVVVATADKSLKFLNAWRPVLHAFHVIVVYYGPEADVAAVKPPSWLSCHVYGRSEIRSALGSKASCIPRDAACRCFGWLVSRKPYILSFSEDCCPLAEAALPEALHTTLAHRPASQLNPLRRHCQNLLTPSTPLHFNTLGDPFEPGADFVRGYPFSLREGVPTAISHGLWLNLADYDACTQLVKPNERNMRYVDATQTISKGALFPMSALNLAFNKSLIGAAMYFPPIGSGQTLGFHDDMWAGWCCKTICDHLGWGVKSGLPYVWRERRVDAFNNLRKEYKGLFWQEELVPFFHSLQLPAGVTAPEACYLEIAKQVKEVLGKVDPTFVKLADGMIMWIEAWRAMQIG